MKKGLKITLIVTGAVLGCGALFLAFGGIPYVRMAERDFPDNDAYLYEPYPYGDRTVPEDYIPLTCNEWTFSAPVQLISKAENDNDTENEWKQRAFVGDYGTDKHVTVIITLPDDMGEFDITGELDENSSALKTKLSDFVLNGYSKKLGYPITDYYTFEDFLYRLSSKDAGISFRNGMAYYGFSKLKNMLVSFPLWEYHTDNADGNMKQVVQTTKDDGTNPHYTTYINLIPKNNRNTVCTAILQATDEDVLYNMINSVQIDPEKAAEFSKKASE